MRYVQLRAFHYVAIHGGFSRAAEALFLTQPAISDQVRKLEEEYDILLFDRTKRRVVVTDKGAKLLEITNRLFDQEKQARDFLTESRGLTSGTLRLFVDSAYHITEILSSFREKYPKIHINLRVGNTRDVVSELYAYNADIGVLGEMPEKDDWDVLQLGSTPLVAFAANGSKYEGLEIGSYQDLAKCDLVMREQGSKTRQKLEAATKSVGVSLRPIIEAQGREGVREIVASGAGIGIVSTAEFGSDERLFELPLPAPCPVMSEYLICLRGRKEQKLIKAFMNLAEDSLRQPETIG
ncbi:MAG: LysR substrate-binding domain-containing protein [Paracoccaceae bacterium]|jgi:aminoethylphosphonate catabolism LysR family transcriptional regulator